MASPEAERFFALFEGYPYAYGRYTVRRADDKGKQTGPAGTIHEPLTVEIVEKHLTPTDTGIGVIPLRADDTCLWGAIDIDVYTIDHAALEAECARHKFPVVVCRTKSGGAHLYLFLSSPVPAALVRRRLEEWAAILGHGGCEVFPKQVNRAGEHDVGNWINLPYQGGDQHTVRYAIRNGKAISLQEFFDLAAETAVDEAALLADRHTGGEAEDLFFEGPPCLQHLHQAGGFPDHTRNEGLFNVAVYLRKRYSDDWKARLNGYNAAMCHPPVDHREVATIEKSVSRKDYGYKCRSAPIAPHCQKRTCLARRFGVGDTGFGSNVMIGGLTKFVTDQERDPATWAIEINGHRVSLSTTELMSPDGVNKRAMEVCSSMPITVPKARWQRQLQDILANCSVMELPPEAGPAGLAWEYIFQFLTQPQQAKEQSEVLLGKPWREGPHVFFRGKDLYEYLTYKRASYGATQADLWHLLKMRGGVKMFWNLSGGRGVNVWRIPVPEIGEVPETEHSFEKPEQTDAF